MPAEKQKIEFLPLGRFLTVSPGTTILDAARQLSVPVSAFCGGQGVCGKCRVRVENGDFPPTDVERSFLTGRELEAGYRLACEAKISGPCTVRIPQEEQFSALLDGQTEKVNLHPAVRYYPVNVPEPELSENPADLKAVLQSAGLDGGYSVPLDVLQKLPHKLRENRFSGIVVGLSGRLVDFCSGPEVKGPYGVAVDLGTTTIVGKLYDLSTGGLLAVSALLNGQHYFGQDVISRISFANENGVKKLQTAAVESINRILAELSESAGVRQEDIYEMTVAGNTVMLHFLLGVSAEFLAVYPYVPVFHRSVYQSAGNIGLNMNPNAGIYCFPVLGRYVGGDTAALLLTLYRKKPGPWLAVDIGTNGEIVLYHEKKYYFCSTAAGPAFEGAHIEKGMRAGNGAIDHIFYQAGRIHYHVMGDHAPRGLCGSALVDAVAVLHRAGLLGPSGTLAATKDFEHHMGTRDGQNCYYFSRPHDVFLTQKDIRRIQLAKGAVAAGVQILLEKTGLVSTKLDAVFLAGAFGQYMDIDNVMYLGMLPDIKRSKVHFVGNAACAGAEMALLSVKERRAVQDLLRRAEYVEIATDPAFQDIFTDNMFIQKK